MTTAPGSRGQVSLAAGQPGSDTGAGVRSKNINIPIQKLIAGLSADNGSDTGVTNLPPHTGSQRKDFLLPSALHIQLN